MIPLLLTICLLCTIVLSSENQRVTPKECSIIRARAAKWKPSPSDPYNDADLVYHQIFLGNVCAAHNDSWLDQVGITLVVSVASEWSFLPYEGQRNIEFEYYAMEDVASGEAMRIKKLWKEIAYRIHNHLQEDDNNRVLVHCNMGISRSSSVVLWYLQHIELITTTYTTLELIIKGRRPVIKPNSLFRKILRSEDY